MYYDLQIQDHTDKPKLYNLVNIYILNNEVTLSHTMLIITMLLYCLRVQILVTSVSQSVSTAELIWIW